jgi:hypothetical protein
MNRQITLAARPVDLPCESDFMRVEYRVPVLDQLMSNIDHACGQF